MKKISQFGFVVLLSAVGFMGCARQAPAQEEGLVSSPLVASQVGNCEKAGSMQGIVGGHVLDTAGDLGSSTVLIIIKTSTAVDLCTGTLIDRNLVLTAGHCALPGSQIKIAFTNNIDCAAQAPVRTLRTVSAGAVHPNYQRGVEDIGNSAHDVAVLKFDGDLPRGYRSRSLPTASFDVAKTDDLVMAGYGITSESAEDSGVLRATKTPATQLLTSFHTLSVGAEVKVPGTWIVDQSKTGVCSGDSGGPLYAQGAGGLTLIGVTSSGINNRSAGAGLGRVCHGVSLFADLRGNLDWLKQVMPRLR